MAITGYDCSSSCEISCSHVGQSGDNYGSQNVNGSNGSTIQGCAGGLGMYIVNTQDQDWNSSNCNGACGGECSWCESQSSGFNYNSSGSSSCGCGGNCSSQCSGCTGECEGGCQGTCETQCNRTCENETQLSNKAQLKSVIDAENLKELFKFIIYEAEERRGLKPKVDTYAIKMLAYQAKFGVKGLQDIHYLDLKDARTAAMKEGGTIVRTMYGQGQTLDDTSFHLSTYFTNHDNEEKELYTNWFNDVLLVKGSNLSMMDYTRIKNYRPFQQTEDYYIQKYKQKYKSYPIKALNYNDGSSLDIYGLLMIALVAQYGQNGLSSEIYKAIKEERLELYSDETIISSGLSIPFTNTIEQLLTIDEWESETIASKNKQKYLSDIMYGLFYDIEINNPESIENSIVIPEFTENKCKEILQLASTKEEYIQIINHDYKSELDLSQINFINGLNNQEYITINQKFDSDFYSENKIILERNFGNNYNELTIKDIKDKLYELSYKLFLLYFCAGDFLIGQKVYDGWSQSHIGKYSYLIDDIVDENLNIEWSDDKIENEFLTYKYSNNTIAIHWPLYHLKKFFILLKQYKQLYEVYLKAVEELSHLPPWFNPNDILDITQLKNILHKVGSEKSNSGIFQDALVYGTEKILNEENYLITEDYSWLDYPAITYYSNNYLTIVKIRNRTYRPEGSPDTSKEEDTIIEDYLGLLMIYIVANRGQDALNDSYFKILTDFREELYGGEGKKLSSDKDSLESQLVIDPFSGTKEVKYRCIIPNEEIINFLTLTPGSKSEEILQAKNDFIFDILHYVLLQTKESQTVNKNPKTFILDKKTLNNVVENGYVSNFKTLIYLKYYNEYDISNEQNVIGEIPETYKQSLRTIQNHNKDKEINNKLNILYYNIPRIFENTFKGVFGITLKQDPQSGTLKEENDKYIPIYRNKNINNYKYHGSLMSAVEWVEEALKLYWELIPVIDGV